MHIGDPIGEGRGGKERQAENIHLPFFRAHVI